MVVGYAVREEEWVGVRAALPPLPPGATYASERCSASACLAVIGVSDSALILPIALFVVFVVFVVVEVEVEVEVVCSCCVWN